MLELTLPPSRDDVLSKVVLEPTASALKRLEKKRGMGEGEITTFLGRMNEVAVGVPYCEGLISRCAKKAIELPYGVITYKISLSKREDEIFDVECDLSG